MKEQAAAAEEVLELRRMKGLPNLAAQAAQAANAFAKFAADRAMGQGAQAEATEALAGAEACVHALIELETVLAREDELPAMAERMADALDAAARATRAAGAALARLP